MNIRKLIENSIAGSNRLMLILALGALAIAIGLFAALSLPYWVAVSGETKTYGAADLIVLGEADTRYNVRVEGGAMLDAGYEEYTTTNGIRTSTDAYFGVLVLEDGADGRFLLVRNPSVIDEDITTYQGILTAPSGISREVYDELTKELPAEAQALLLPMMLDTVDQSGAWIAGTVALATLALLGVWGIITFVRRRNPANHPFVKGLRPHGEFDGVVRQIEGDAMLGTRQVAKAMFSRNWVMYATPKMFRGALKLSDIAWLHKHSVRSRYGTNHYAQVWDKHGTLLSIDAKDKEVDEMLIAIAQAAPHAIAGYSKDIEKQWKQQRASFLQEVERRRQALQANAQA